MEKTDFIIKIISGIAGLVSACESVWKFRKQKEHEQAETAFRSLYIPAMELIEDHLYVSNKDDFNKPSFISCKTSLHKLIDEQYIYVPFNLQDTFNDFEKSTGDNRIKSYNKFCDCFINYYRENANACGMKRLSVWRRNKLKWYSSTQKMILTNAMVIGEIISTLLMVVSISLIATVILLNALQWLGAVL